MLFERVDLVRKLITRNVLPMLTPPPEAQNDPDQHPSPDSSEPAYPSIFKVKKKKKKVGDGVETLFRTTLSSHIRLSEMADRKANLMISINSIIISIVISAYARKFDAPAGLILPSILLLAVCLVTIILSLIATNPTISPIKQKTAPSPAPIDLLFFGQYTRLTADEYRHSLLTLLSREDDIYTSMINNIYAQGQVLSRKYRLLKWAYQFFMIGFSVVVLIVIISLCVAHLG